MKRLVACILSLWCIILAVLKPTSSNNNIIECGSCTCNNETNTLISCTVYQKSWEEQQKEQKECSYCLGDIICEQRIFITNANISNVSPSFAILGYNSSDPITVEFGRGLFMETLGNFANILKLDRITVTKLIVEDNTSLPIEELNSFYQTFLDDIIELCVHDFDLRASEGNEKSTKFELTDGSSQKEFKNLIMRTSEHKKDMINLKTDLLFRVEGNHIRISTLKNASISEVDIYFKPKPSSTFAKFFLTTTCTESTHYITHPRLIQVNPSSWNYDNNLMSISLSFQRCKDVVLPASFLAYFKHFDKLYFRTAIPTLIEYGALGTEQLKMKEIKFKDNKNLKITNEINQAWSKAECGSLKDINMCVLCLMQHFGFHRITDNLEEKCSNGETNSIGRVRKCLSDCPKNINYPQGVDIPVYEGYKKCDSETNLTVFCKTEEIKVTHTRTSRQLSSFGERIVDAPKVIFWLKVVASIEFGSELNQR